MKTKTEKTAKTDERRKYDTPRITHEDSFSRTSLASCTLTGVGADCIGGFDTALSSS
jgi:hypothetical protein